MPIRARNASTSFLQTSGAWYHICAGLALDATNNILFASCRDNKNMIILSALDGHIITDLPTGNGSDGATFKPATKEAFSSQGDGTLTVVQENSPTSFSVEQTVVTPARAKTLTLDTKTNQIYTITAEYGPVPVILVCDVPAQRELTSMRVPLRMARISLPEVLRSRSINGLLPSDRLPGAVHRGLWRNRTE
jgi:hypothetical protein